MKYQCRQCPNSKVSESPEFENIRLRCPPRSPGPQEPMPPSRERTVFLSLLDFPLHIPGTYLRILKRSLSECNANVSLHSVLDVLGAYPFTLAKVVSHNSRSSNLATQKAWPYFWDISSSERFSLGMGISPPQGCSASWSHWSQGGKVDSPPGPKRPSSWDPRWRPADQRVRQVDRNLQRTPTNGSKHWKKAAEMGPEKRPTKQHWQRDATASLFLH